MNKVSFAAVQAVVFSSATIAGPILPVSDDLVMSLSTNVLTNTLSSMAPNSWMKINLNEFQDVWTPSGQRPTWASPSTNISAWSGAAWDSERKDLHIWGGDIGNEEGNEIYSFRSSTGLWERSSLPSQITNDGGYTHTVDGIYNAPISGESWDSVVYLENADRMAVIAISRNGKTFLNESSEATGPYFWDPAMADPNKVSGITGSHVDPTSYPDVVGGEMWQNRDNFTPGIGKGVSGVTAYVNQDDKDIVYFSDVRNDLWRYTVNDLDPVNDTWEQIGRRSMAGENGSGSGAFDPTRDIFLQTIGGSMFSYWDVNKPGSYSTNRAIMIDPMILSGGLLEVSQYYGIQYDPVLDGFLLWNGNGDIWFLEAPDTLDPDGDGVQNEADGWILTLIEPSGIGPTLPDQYTGVFGKWNYLAEEQAYLGVIDPIAGDVFAYKPAYVPIPAAVWLFASAIGCLCLISLRNKTYMTAASHGEIIGLPLS